MYQEAIISKAKRIHDRQTNLKDYVDLYFLLKEGITNLEQIVELCEKKYGDEFNRRLFLEQMVYSKDIEEAEIQFLKERVDKLEIEKFFEEEIKKLKI